MESNQKPPFETEALKGAYENHPVFGALKYYVDFYESLSDYAVGPKDDEPLSRMHFSVFESMLGSLRSMQELLEKRRVMDAQAVLVRFTDAALHHVYATLFCMEVVKYGTSLEEQMACWMEEMEPLPDRKKMQAYITEYEDMFEMAALFKDQYDLVEMREGIALGNEQYSLFDHYLNHELVITPLHMTALNTFLEVLSRVIVYQMSYLFYASDDIMKHQRFEEFLAAGIVPNQESLQEVAAYIQTFCDRILKPNFPEIYQEIKRKSDLKLN